MAVLKGKTYNDTFFDLGFEPIPPSIEGPHDAYKVTIWRNGEQEFQQVYNVTGYWSGHRDLFKIARQFKNAKNIVDLTTDIEKEVDAFGWDVKPNSLSVRMDVTWFECVMWGRNGIGGPSFSIVVYLLPKQIPRAYDIVAPVRVVRIPCWVEDVVVFGKTLEQELLKMKARRKELAMLGPWEK